MVDGLLEVLQASVPSPDVPVLLSVEEGGGAESGKAGSARSGARKRCSTATQLFSHAGHSSSLRRQSASLSSD